MISFQFLKKKQVRNELNPLPIIGEESMTAVNESAKSPPAASGIAWKDPRISPGIQKIQILLTFF